MEIPFNKPATGPEEARAAAQVAEGDVLRGNGPVSDRVEAQLEELLGARHVFLTTSCTHALEMAMITLELGPGDEVIMPSFNFVSSGNAVVLRGATPVFADIRPDTLNLDPAEVEERITPDTRAIVPVHYAGVGCEMDELMAIAEEHDLYVVEDAAQAIDADYEDRPLGTIGDIGCLSFHETKNLTSGEGGAFVTDDDEIARTAELVREKGTNRSAFVRGEVDHYTWVHEGSSYIQSDILAAVLEVQLRRRKEIREKRRRVWEGYYERLAPLAETLPIRLPHVPANRRSNYHIFFFRTEEKGQRDRVLGALKEAGIQATFHYIPLHDSPFGRAHLAEVPELPVTSRCSDTLIRLPLYPKLADRAEEVADRAAEILRSELA